MENLRVSDALQDLTVIQRSIIAMERLRDSQVPRSAFQTHLYLLVLSFFLCTILLALELATAFISRHVNLIQTDASSRTFHVLALAGLLLAGTVNLYIAIWRGARLHGENLQNHIERNFTYAKNITHTSDLFAKFAVMAVLIMAGSPQWASPLLLVFTADYLIQGRLFVLPVRFSIALAAICFMLAVFQFCTGAFSFYLPLAAFLGVCATSIAHIMKLKRVAG